MNANPLNNSVRIWAVLLRVLGVGVMILAVILNVDRAGDWFFRSETFPDRLSPVLLALRIALGASGIFLLIFGSALANRVNISWNRLKDIQKITVQIAIVAMFVAFIHSLSVYFRENLLLIGEIARHRYMYKMLGFEVMIQDNPLMTSDFFTCIFLSMAAILSYMIHFFNRLSADLEQDDSHPSPGIVWILLALGFCFAAFDEYFGIHEFVGDNIIKQRDDVVMMLYSIAAAAVLIRYIRYFLSFKPGFAMFFLGTFFQAAAVLLDKFAVSAFFEEGFEALGAVFYLGGTALYLLWQELFLKKSK